ncbi:radical SAM protein [Actinomadura graeca]|uniref:Radical SAM protein n=1 Tax=Actinomadura graeca TaxID=2750812 RepID=A0ABX8RA39_9ACTN|nr:radical SAM protein [Actinomadura graeca]QXJ25853.1 radical SAM protein [Actinomadura graeca]
MLWLELGTLCQLACRHCYNDSGADGDHGVMTVDDWRRAIGEAADLGTCLVQFIGGEPTLHPGLPVLIGATRRAGLQVEVYSNLVHLTEPVWTALAQEGVRLATSFYSDDPDEHRQITGRDTHRQTRINIVRAVELGIPVRAGIVEVLDGQRTAQARAMLAAMGVQHVGSDRVRPFGRAAPAGGHDPGELCGHCGRGNAVVLASGSLAPCPMSRWMAHGDVRTSPLAGLLEETWRRARDQIAPAHAGCGPHDGCQPPCEPQKCDPDIPCTPED